MVRSKIDLSNVEARAGSRRLGDMKGQKEKCNDGWNKSVSYRHEQSTQSRREHVDSGEEFWRGAGDVANGWHADSASEAVGRCRCSFAAVTGRHPIALLRSNGRFPFERLTSGTLPLSSSCFVLLHTAPCFVFFEQKLDRSDATHV